MRDNGPFRNRGASDAEMRWLAGAGVAVAAIAMVAWTWRTWPDAVSDSGRELYVAWQLGAGHVLYRDVAYFNGPLSPYLNALWFAVAGPGLAVLEFANAVVTVLIALLTWRLVRAGAGLGGATAALLLFVTIFATGPLTLIGSFSYLIPYSHEMTHGLLLLLALLVLLERTLTRPDAASAIAVGGLVGLALLTKPEFAIAAAMIVATGLGLAAWRGGGARHVGWVASTATAVPLLAWAALATAMPVRLARDGLLGSWSHLTDSRLTQMPYFRMFMGIDRPWANVGALIVWSAVWLSIAVCAVVAGRLIRGGRTTAVFAAVVIAVVIAVAHETIPWYDVFRPLPVVALWVLAWAVRRLTRAPRGDAETRPIILTAAAAAGALALTFKMILFARVWHYGFVLGMPAAMLGVAAISSAVRDKCRDLGGSPTVASGVLAGVLIGTIVGHLFLMAPIVGTRTVTVGRGRDAFRSDGRGVAVNGAIEAIERASRDDATLAVLPDGVMISYLTRRANSTPYIIGNPADIAIFGEARMLDAYRAHPPDLFAITKCDTTIYGFPGGFGRDYAQGLGAWITREYVPAGMIGADEGEEAFRLALLRHTGYSAERSRSTKE